MRRYNLFIVLFGLLASGWCHGQEVTIKVGTRDSLWSSILNENRSLIISLPDDYQTSNQPYPVLYLLDGTENSLLEARLITNSLKTTMIIVAIRNTDRDRDMMPLSTPSYEVKNPGAGNFLAFLESELIPHIDKKYRSNGHRIIRGRSLSGLFVLYAFLKKPTLFDSYIGNSAGWYADMGAFFEALTDEAFAKKEVFDRKKLFIANSLADPFDPDKEVHQAMVKFSEKINAVFGNSISFNYVTYDNYGHVPYPSFYDGLKYILEQD